MTKKSISDEKQLHIALMSTDKTDASPTNFLGNISGYVPSRLAIVKIITASSIVAIGPLYAYFTYPSMKTGLDVLGEVFLGATALRHKDAEFWINSTGAFILVNFNLLSASLSFVPMDEAYRLVQAKSNSIVPVEKTAAYCFYSNLLVANLVQFIPGALAGSISIMAGTSSIPLKVFAGLTITSLDLMYYHLFYLEPLKQHAELSLSDFYQGLAVMKNQWAKAIEFGVRILFTGLGKGVSYGFIAYEFGIKSLELEKSNQTLAVIVLLILLANVYVTFVTRPLSLYKMMFKTPEQRTYLETMQNTLFTAMTCQTWLRNILRSLILRALPACILLQNQANAGWIAAVLTGIILGLGNLKARHEISKDDQILNTKDHPTVDESGRKNSWEEQVEIYKKDTQLARFSTAINSGGLIARFVLFLGFVDVLLNQTFADRGWVKKQTPFDLLCWTLLLSGLLREAESILWHNKISETTASHMVRWNLVKKSSEMQKPVSLVNHACLLTSRAVRWATCSSQEIMNVKSEVSLSVFPPAQ